MSLVKVSAGSEKKRYYHYYAQGLAPLPEEFQEKIKNAAIYNEGGLALKDRSQFLEANATLPAKTGVYPLSEGGLLVASNMRVPNFTGEMLYWYFPWQVLEPLRYAIWDPEDHVDNQVSDVDRQRILDPAIPVREKIWGVTFHAVEAMGGESEKVDITFYNPADFGLDASSCEFLIASNSLLGEQKIPVVMLEALKKINGVNELHLRFWIGYQIIDGEAKYLLPPEIKIPAEVGLKLIEHNFREFNNLHTVLPSLYAEEKDNW